jgi:integrase
VPRSIRTFEIKPVYTSGDTAQKPRAWRARFRITDQTTNAIVKEGSKTCPLKVQLERELERLKKQVDDFNQNEERRRRDQHDGDAVFGPFARAYVDTTKRAALTSRSWINLDGRLRNHILPVLGDMRFDDITTEVVQDLLNNITLVGKHKEGKEPSPSTIKPVYDLINRIMDKAVVANKILRNPCNEIDTRNELPAEEEGPEMLFLMHEEIELLAHEIDPRFQALIYVAAYSGLRAGELWALKRTKLILPVGEVGKIQVHWAQSEPYGHIVVKPTKSRRRREVWIPQKVSRILREHLLAYPSPDGLVFTAPEGGRIRHNNFKTRFFNRAVDAACVPQDADHRLRFHDLRHTAAAIWLSEGCSFKELQDLLGDTSRAVERYGRKFRSQPATLMERIDQRVSDRPASNRGAVSDIRRKLGH